MRAPRSEGKSLAARLFAILFAFAFLSFVAATAIAAYVSWTVYEGDEEERLIAQLETTTAQLTDADPEDMVAALAQTNLADTRITLVGPNGTVLYDSLVDVLAMGNHAGREEIVLARKLGESVVLRKSETTGTDSLYVAALAGTDGAVLRLAESRASLAYYIGSLLAPLSLAVLAAALLAAALAHAITQRMAAPLVNVNLDAPLRSDTYREVRPLLNRIDAQRVELLRQNEQLERAVEMRREFTGNVSHEMKSPLQVIGGYAELIEAGIATPEDTRRFAGLIRSESQSMRTLIDDVLMLSRLDEGACDEMQPVDVSKVVERVVGRLSPTAASKGIQIDFSAPEATLAVGAEPLVEQAAYNLVDNAIRYGGTQVVICARTVGSETCVAVSDDGPGVPENQRERVFERFFRIDPSRSRSTGGTGLGLAIVKHAADSMGGSVLVGDSELGGAQFTLILPAAKAQPPIVG